MQTVDYPSDDFGQIAFVPIQNLDSELIQCDISFGFTKRLEIDLKSEDIDNARNKEISLARKKINFISFNLFLRKLKLTDLQSIRNGRPKREKAIGFSNFALLIKYKGLYLDQLFLIIKKYNEAEKQTMIEAILKISNNYDLFVVDNSMGSVIESKAKISLENYLNYNN